MKKFLLSVLTLALTMQAWAQNDADSHNYDLTRNLKIFHEVVRDLDLMYVDTLNADEMITAGINAMLRTMDPYTTYYPEDKTKDLRQMITGKYAGIGSVIRYNLKLGRVVIEEPYANTPAAEAGLRKGDVIVSIDDSLMTDKMTDYVSSRLRGDAGTTFVLKVMRPSTGETLTRHITRRAIQMPAIPFYGMRDGGVGYICLDSFTENCYEEFRAALMALRAKGMTSLVIDLRGNGGGSLMAAVDIVNLFVPKGITLVTTKGKLERSNKEYVTQNEPLDTEIPIVVLVDDDTASASEITSGSLQDLDRAVILGERTFGKGLVQTPLDLSFNTQLKLTTSRYHIPSGRCIQAINYHHEAGGYREHVPDSLTREFSTIGGRKVRDGGGITPDVVMKADSLSNIAYYLLQTGMDSTEVMHEWIVDYVAKHDKIGDAATFRLSDEELADFRQKVLDSGFKYDRMSRKAVDQLALLLKAEGYYDDAQAELEALKAKLEHNLGKDFDRNAEQIRLLLSNSIVKSYYFQAGAAENRLQYDRQMDEAVRLLQTPEEYKALLTPGK